MSTIWVNGHGWVMGGDAVRGLRFTKIKAGAKPFAGIKEDYKTELFDVCKYIEIKMQCNYDIIRG